MLWQNNFSFFYDRSRAHFTSFTTIHVTLKIYYRFISLYTQKQYYLLNFFTSIEFIGTDDIFFTARRKSCAIYSGVGVLCFRPPPQAISRDGKLITGILISLNISVSHKLCGPIRPTYIFEVVSTLVLSISDCNCNLLQLSPAASFSYSGFQRELLSKFKLTMLLACERYCILNGVAEFSWIYIAFGPKKDLLGFELWPLRDPPLTFSSPRGLFRSFSVQFISEETFIRAPYTCIPWYLRELLYI